MKIKNNGRIFKALFMHLQELTSIRLSSAYDKKGLVLRIVCDLLLSNAGLFLGYFFTLIYFFITGHTKAFLWGDKFLLTHWLNTVPIFTVVCIASFTLLGLYSRGIRYAPSYRFIIVLRAVIVAFLVHAFSLYLLRIMLPRSSIIFGFVFVLFFMIVTRVGRSIFYRKFVMLPRIDRERGLAETLRNIDIVASESGWVNPEKTAGSKQRSDESKVLFPARFAMWPYFEEDEINAAVSVLRSGRINRWTGEHGVLFEKEFAAFCKCTNAITVANGTVALELALQALGIGPGDEVIVPCRTFIATASSVVMRGATPVMADVDAESQVLTTETILPVLTPKTKAVIAVHLNGWPCDMDSIMEVARSHGIKVIEDCAHAHGAKYKDRPVGSLGDVAAFSFCQDKIMTTAGEGGMFTTNNTDIWKRAWGFKDHGKSYDTVYNKEHPPGFRWLHEGLGTNWRLTEIQSAIGRIMLKKLAFWVETRRRYAHHLTEAFSEIAALRVTNPPPEIYHSYYKYYAFVRPARLKQGWDRDRIINAITAEGIPCYAGVCGQVHREKVFADTAYAPARELPVSKALMDTSLMFLVHPTLSESDIDTTIRVVKSVMARATWC